MMAERSQNPYASPLAEREFAFAADAGSFSLTGAGICCRRNVVLPKVCLQTGATTSLKPHGIVLRVTSLLYIGIRWVGFAILALAVAFPILQWMFPSYRLVGIPEKLVLSVSVPSGFVGILIILFSQWMRPRVTINAFLSTETDTNRTRGLLILAMSKLPLIVFVVLVFTRRFLDSVSSWKSTAIVAIAVALHWFLPKVLEYHWKSTRDRGLTLRAVQTDAGAFEVTGFSDEFLKTLRQAGQHQ